LALVFFLGSKSCPSSMDITGVRIVTQKLRDFPLFHVSPPPPPAPLQKQSRGQVPLRPIQFLVILEGKLSNPDLIVSIDHY
jgi:hypothetical protein